MVIALTNGLSMLDMFAQSKQHAPGSGNVYQTVETADGRNGDIPGYSTFAVRTAYDFGQDFLRFKSGRLGLKTYLIKNILLVPSDSTGGKYVGQPRTFYLQTSVDF